MKFCGAGKCTFQRLRPLFAIKSERERRAENKEKANRTTTVRVMFV